ncbi:MAG: chromate transporter [Firmicutes bacterium]|nr:chromate transporter [Bacillota bacterium]
MILLTRLCDLFLSFSRIGLTAFGGGYAMIPLLRTEFIVARQWLTLGEFLDIIAIAEMTPGPVAINAATYIGYKVAGVPGAAAATLGVITPSVVLILIIAGLFQHYRSSPLVRAVISGIRPAVIALIFSAVLVMGRPVLVDFRAFFISLAAFLLLITGKMRPLPVIGLSALLGLLLY